MSSYSQSSMSPISPLTQSLQLIPHDAPLRKITPTDKFPCFACFDKPVKRLSCQICSGQGYVMGDHPMVQFAQDFIQKKITKNNVNKSFNQNNSSKLQRKSLGKIPSVIQQSQQQDYQQNQPRHQGVFCNNCNMDPIVGTRFQCTQCADYDICKNCFQKNVHPQDHKMRAIQNPNSIRSSYRPSIQVLDRLRQSSTQMTKSRFNSKK